MDIKNNNELEKLITEEEKRLKEIYYKKADYAINELLKQFISKLKDEEWELIRKGNREKFKNIKDKYIKK